MECQTKIFGFWRSVSSKIVTKKLKLWINIFSFSRKLFDFLVGFIKWDTFCDITMAAVSIHYVSLVTDAVAPPQEAWRRPCLCHRDGDCLNFPRIHVEVTSLSLPAAAVIASTIKPGDTTLVHLNLQKYKLLIFVLHMLRIFENLKIQSNVWFKIHSSFLRDGCFFNFNFWRIALFIYFLLEI